MGFSNGYFVVHISVTHLSVPGPFALAGTRKQNGRDKNMEDKNMGFSNGHFALHISVTHLFVPGPFQCGRVSPAIATVLLTCEGVH